MNKWKPKYKDQSENDRFWCQKCKEYRSMSELIIIQPQKLICKDCLNKGNTSEPTYGGEE